MNIGYTAANGKSTEMEMHQAVLWDRRSPSNREDNSFTPVANDSPNHPAPQVSFAHAGVQPQGELLAAKDAFGLCATKVLIVQVECEIIAVLAQRAVVNSRRDSKKLASFCIHMKDDGIFFADVEPREDSLERVAGHRDLLTAPMSVPAVGKKRRAPKIVLPGAFVDMFPSLAPITVGTRNTV